MRGVPKEAEVTITLRSGREHGVVQRESAAWTEYNRMLASWELGSTITVIGDDFAWCVKAADIESIRLEVVEPVSS